MGEISKEAFLEYDRIRRSGATNMLAVYTVIALSGGKLTRDTCIKIMDNYNDLRDKYCPFYGKSK